MKGEFCPAYCEFLDAGVPVVCQGCQHAEDVVYSAPVKVTVEPNGKSLNLLGKNRDFYYTDKGFMVHESRVIFQATR